MPPPFRADHVGRLLRPPARLAARAEFEAGRIAPDEQYFPLGLVTAKRGELELIVETAAEAWG